MTIDIEVRAASDRFYAALNGALNGDAGALADIWSHGGSVTTMHPAGGRSLGWDAVRESFERFAGVASGGEVRLAEQRIECGGDMAYEVGTEQGHFRLSDAELTVSIRVTNVYRREAGGWRIVHHHTDASPEVIAALDGPKPA